MSCRMFARFVLALSLLGMLCGGTAAQAAGPDGASNPCFEIIVPQRQGVPDGPLLFNKCTGATWLLVRWGGKSRRPGYRWVSLEVDDAARANPGARAVPPQVSEVKPHVPGNRCFDFVGRRYCE